MATLPRWVATPVVVPLCTVVLAADLPARQAVLTDGRFDEWGAAPIVIADPIDASPDAAIDIRNMQMLDDPRFVYLALDVSRPVNAQSMRGTVRIVFDADDDSGTGSRVHSVGGADLVLELSRMDKPRPDGFGAGIGIRLVTADGASEVQSAYPLKVIAAPTHSSSRFEIRIARGRSLGGVNGLFASASIRLQVVLVDPSGLQDDTDVGTYTFDTPVSDAVSPPQPPDIAKQGDVFRAVVWNVAYDSFRDQSEHHNHVLAALDPDILLLDEVFGAMTVADIERVFRAPPLGDLHDWQLVLGGSGGNQKTLVATWLPIRAEPLLREVRHAPATIDSVERLVDSTYSRLFRLERSRGVAVTGAWVTISGRDVLFVPADLQSAGYEGSPEDRLRELQTLTIRDRVHEILAERGPAPLVIGGDLNLVGSVRPLRTLQRGLDANGQDLAVANAYRMTDGSQSTWRHEPDDQFTPGRLDFILFSSSFLEEVRTFVFDPEELPDELLRVLGVQKDDAAISSDHLPVVLDFRVRSRPGS